MARRHDGSNVYALAPAAPVNWTGYTVALWCRPTEAFDFASLAMDGLSGFDPRNQWTRASAALRLDAAAEGVNQTFVACELPINTWVHLVLRRKQADAVDGISVWRNGEKVVARASGTITPFAVDWMFGRRWTNTARDWRGDLAEIHTYETALSDGRCAQLWRGPLLDEASLGGYWRVDGIKSPEPDLSLLQRHATVTGTVRSPMHAPVGRPHPPPAPAYFRAVAPPAQACALRAVRLALGGPQVGIVPGPVSVAARAARLICGGALSHVYRDRLDVRLREDLALVTAARYRLREPLADGAEDGYRLRDGLVDAVPTYRLRSGLEEPV